MALQLNSEYLDEFEIADIAAEFDSIMPRIDWTTYVGPSYLLSPTNWVDAFGGAATVENICYVWADAENQGKIIT